MRTDRIGSSSFVRFLEAADSCGRIARFPLVDASGRSLVATKVAIDDEGRFFDVLSDIDESEGAAFTKWLSFTADTVTDAHVSLYDAVEHEIYDLSPAMIANLGIDPADAKGSSLQDIRDDIRQGVLERLDMEISNDVALAAELVERASKAFPPDQRSVATSVLERRARLGSSDDDAWAGTMLESYVPEGGIDLVLEHLRDPENVERTACRNLLKDLQIMIGHSLLTRKAIEDALPSYLRRRDEIVSRAGDIMSAIAGVQDPNSVLTLYAARDGRAAMFIATARDIACVLERPIDHEMGMGDPLPFSALPATDAPLPAIIGHDVRRDPGSIPSVFDIIGIGFRDATIYAADRDLIAKKLACVDAETAIVRLDAATRDELMDGTARDAVGVERLAPEIDMSMLSSAEGRAICHGNVTVGRHAEASVVRSQAMEALGAEAKVGDVVLVGREAFLVDSNKTIPIPKEVNIDNLIAVVKETPCEGIFGSEPKAYDLEIKAREALLSCGMEKLDEVEQSKLIDQSIRKA